MAPIIKSITFTVQQDIWIKQQIENGNYTNEIEYLMDLVRKNQADKQKLEELRAAIKEGLDSGLSERTVKIYGKKQKSGMHARMANYKLSLLAESTVINRM